ncbi:hypothetical protein VTK73DRAFT_247 [Phialemonium thermophilum]|uniref:Uncharacterized protein n=1 Tax=Phialemonium thermophilum TaxID=223376 RepID=A0ABR3VW60_9PEZI
MGGLNIGSLPPINTDGFPDMRRFSPSARSNAASRHQQNGIAPLDLAIGEYNGARDFQHLSPVYENRTPPAAVRKADPLAQAEKPPAMTIRPSTPPSDAWDASSRPERKPAAPAKSQQTAVSSTAVRKDGLPNPPAVANPRVNGISKENGHTRSAKSESEGLGGGWQKPKNRKKGIADLKGAANAFSHGEQPPRNESERKGG